VRIIFLSQSFGNAFLQKKIKSSESAGLQLPSLKLTANFAGINWTIGKQWLRCMFISLQNSFFMWLIFDLIPAPTKTFFFDFSLIAISAEVWPSSCCSGWVVLCLLNTIFCWVYSFKRVRRALCLRTTAQLVDSLANEALDILENVIAE